jgi:hypothetical protein
VKSWRSGDLSAARARGHVAAGEGICSFDALGIPQDLKTGHQLDITRGSAGGRHAGANGLVGGQVFGPVLLERVLCIGLVGKTGLFVAPENNVPAPGRLTARPDLQRRRAASASPPSSPLRRRTGRSRCRAGRLRWCAGKLLVLADGRSIEVGCRCLSGACRRAGTPWAKQPLAPSVNIAKLRAANQSPAANLRRFAMFGVAIELKDRMVLSLFCRPEHAPPSATDA